MPALLPAPAPATLPRPEPAAAPAGRREESAALVFAALPAFASFLLIGIHHLRDGYHLDLASGIYAAMAQEVRHGRLYPDLGGTELLGGTRYMPLQFFLHAGLSLVTGEYLLSGKLLALGLSLALVALVAVALRRLGCPLAAAVALGCLVPASGPAFWAATTIRGDLLPVVLQLAALAVAVGHATLPRAALAGVLCALAVLAKLTAVWAGVALAVYYLARDRRAAVAFAAAGAAALLGPLAVIHRADGGRMADNFAALSAAGVGGLAALAKAPLRLLRFAGNGGSVVNVLLPLALFGGWRAWRAGRWTPYHTALVASLPVLVVIFADKGTVSNHLLDLVALCVIVTGALWADAASEKLRPALTLVVAWCLLTCWATVLAAEAREVVGYRLRGEADGRFPAEPVATLVGGDEAFLADDAWVAVSRGRRPVVLDPYSLARLVEARPAAADGLVARIRAREFARVVLTDYHPDPDDDPDDYYLGRPVHDAVRAHYRLWKTADGYRVYVPKE